jgi:metal transporter CNNM
MQSLTWIGIVFCVSQSAMFSGLNLAFFSISKLQIEIGAARGDKDATRILHLRTDSNFLLATILWGNVGVNVLLTLLSNSIMAGVAAFFFSTFVITFFGEIIPQAYFSRHALKMASLMAPILRIYQYLLFPLSKTTSFFLDKWLGKEAIQYFHERDLEELIHMHIKSAESDVDRVEGRGALNFLAIDDLRLEEEGEQIDPRSIISLPFKGNRPVFPSIDVSISDPFLNQIQLSGKKWIIITDPSNEPRIVLNSDGFLRDALFNSQSFNPFYYCHRPIIVKDPQRSLGEVIPQLKVHPMRSDDDVIDQDIILFWGHTKKVITGADILGRLMRGIVQQLDVPFTKVL